MARRRIREAPKTDIQRKGSGWLAAVTPQSMLSEAGRKSLLGLMVDEADLEATAAAIQSMERLSALRAAPALPPKVDWRNNDGNWVTPVKNQGNCCSCVAFGTIAALESRTRIVCKNANMAIDLSEAHLLYCGCGNCCMTGWNFAPALNFCKSPGVCKEADFPYATGNVPCKAGVAPYAKITAWTAVLSIADRKNVLATKGPVVGGMAVYRDFLRYQSGVYTVTSTESEFAGYSCICVVGYDDTQQCWICKNSWGTAWGESGFFRIGYGQAKIDTSFPFYDMDAVCSVPLCEEYVAYLKNVMLAARTNANLRICLKRYVCGGAIRPPCTTPVVPVVKNVLLILQKCPQYRRPFCAAL